MLMTFVNPDSMAEGSKVVAFSRVLQVLLFRKYTFIGIIKMYSIPSKALNNSMNCFMKLLKFLRNLHGLKVSFPFLPFQC